MYGIDEHAYARALVHALKHESIDARITESGEEGYSTPSLLIEEEGRELLIEDFFGGLPWSKFHSEEKFWVTIKDGAFPYTMGAVVPTDAGLESVVDAVREILGI